MLIAGKHFIPEYEFDWQFVQSPGPGGQNVNKVATAVRLGFNLRDTTAIHPELKAKLLSRLAHRLNSDGVLSVSAHSERSQSLNRRTALEKLAELLETALIEPKKRKKTRPTAASVRRRLEDKAKHSALKRSRLLSFPEKRK